MNSLSIRPCQFSQSDIYYLGGWRPRIWGLSKEGGDSHKLSAVNPKFLATAKSGGIFLEISLFENPHDLLNPE
jgi:hypothetical protein